MVRIAICDDSHEHLDTITDMIKNWENPPVHIFTEGFDNGDSLLAAHSREPFDIIFLDIIMPVFNGMDTAHEIREFDKNVDIVFLTSSKEFAIESYSVKASNYLLKPVDADKLFDTITDLSKDLASEEKHIIIREGSISYRVSLSSIEYIEAQNKSVCFTLCDGRKFRTTDKFYTYEEMLFAEKAFFKCHRSYLINLFQVSSYSSKEVTMQQGDRIPISRGCHKEFESAYFSALFREAGDTI